MTTTEDELKGTNETSLRHADQARDLLEDRDRRTSKKATTKPSRRPPIAPRRWKTSSIYNKKLNGDSEEIKKKNEEESRILQTQDQIKLQLLKSSADESRMSSPDGGQRRSGRRGQLHALVLDISRGRPLWDDPLGKITRIDLQNARFTSTSAQPTA